MSPALANLDPQQQQHVRTRVRGLLEKSEAFKALPADEQRTLAKSMVDTVAYLADPKAGQSGAPGLARAQAEGDEQRPTGIGDAARAGAQAYEDLTGAVDFPKFVSGLIDGVFNAIVTASIRQMDAYQKLLENVTKSVDNFAKDNFTINQGRDYLADRFPNLLQIDHSGGQPRLAPTEEGEETGLGEIKTALASLSDPRARELETRVAQLLEASFRSGRFAQI